MLRSAADGAVDLELAEHALDAIALFSDHPVVFYLRCRFDLRGCHSRSPSDSFIAAACDNGVHACYMENLDRTGRVMYDNNYFDIPLEGLAFWIVVAASGSFVINLLMDAAVRNRLLRLWIFFPAIAISGLIIVLYFVLPDDSFTPSGRGLVMLTAAILLSLIITPPWAAVVWCSNKLAVRYRRKRGAVGAADGD